MAVYVDKLVKHPDAPPAIRRVSLEWCHMFADSLDELHAMADRVGLRRPWFQGPPRHRMSHYDLTPSRRAAAVRAGAVELDYDLDEHRAIRRRVRAVHLKGEGGWLTCT